MSGTQLPIINVPNTAPAYLLGTVSGKHKIQLRVLNTNVTLRFGSDRWQIEILGAGFPITSTDGLIEMEWEDAQVWAMGLASNPAQPQVMFGIN